MINNSAKYIELRNRYQTFYYQGFSYILKDKSLEIVFSFNIDDEIYFKPKLTFENSDYFHFEKINFDDLQTLIFNIGMVELVSYWKACATKRVVVKGFKLSKPQVDFWKKIYFHGLGEYFYLNGIEPDYEDFMHIESHGRSGFKKLNKISLEGCIIPVGGGKDSVVSMEILRRNHDKNLVFIMNPRGATLETSEIAHYKNKTLVVSRVIDQNLLELNKQGYLNGHTPFSALLAFTTLLVAYASGRREIALSNESSANEPTVAGTKINHQYSKSFEFETDFRNYVREFISDDLQYFSLLRPIGEFQIASIFAKNEKYFPIFKSCNSGSKTNSWCGECPKCLFTFIILSPFVSPSRLETIFGKNLFESPELLEYFKELIGDSEVKPFECIGTVDEVVAATCLAIKKYYKPKYPVLLDYFVNSKKFDSCSNVDEQSLLSEINTQNYLPENYMKMLEEELNG